MHFKRKLMYSGSNSIINPRMYDRVYILPVLLFVWFIGSFAVTYIIAAYHGHIIPILPFISDTGTYLPESAVFAQLLNIGSVLMAVSVYIRYLQVQRLLQINKLNRYAGFLNVTCLWLGLLIAVGVSIVANFQETNAFIMHLVGSGFAMGFGVLFQILQTLLCVLIYPRLGSKLVNRSRIIVVAVSCIALARCIPPYFSGLTDTGGKRLKPGDPEYGYQLMNVIAEWMIMLLTMVFILTFIYEFKRITLYEPHIEIINKHVE